MDEQKFFKFTKIVGIIYASLTFLFLIIASVYINQGLKYMDLILIPIIIFSLYIWFILLGIKHPKLGGYLSIIYSGIFMLGAYPMISFMLQNYILPLLIWLLVALPGILYLFLGYYNEKFENFINKIGEKFNFIRKGTANINNLKKSTLILIVALILIVSAGASSFLFGFPYDPLRPPMLDDSASTPEGMNKLIEANNKFALDLYDQVDSITNNVFFSPYSISTAMMIAREGARTQTANEIDSVFYYPELEIMRNNFAGIYNNMNEDHRSYQLKTGNAIWIQQDFPFKEKYKNNVENFYGAKAVNLDFINNAAESVNTINNFISEQTNGKIDNILNPSDITYRTRAILTNAIYFKGDWVYSFKKSKTQLSDFYLNDRTKIQTDMMNLETKETKLNYVDLGNLQLLELPYKGDDLSMLIILPRTEEEIFKITMRDKNIKMINTELTLDNLYSWKSQMRKIKLNQVIIPKFKFDSKYELNDILKTMGMPLAFNDAYADFSGMAHLSPDERMFIEKVIHQAYVKVDEKGTEATAATAISMGFSNSAGPSTSFIADHPFTFIIQNKNNGNILFIGKVNDPRK